MRSGGGGGETLRSPRRHPFSLLAYRHGQRVGEHPPGDALRNLCLRHIEDSAKEGTSQGEGFNPLSVIIPLLTAVSASSTWSNKVETKPSRYLVAKGLPTLPMKLVEKIWNLEYVDMEEFLPTPRSLQLAEQGSASSFQESLVGAFSQYQALQQHKSQRLVVDIGTWTHCFTPYIAVLSKKAADMVPSMVAHLHTVLRLQQKASHQLAWLEYDIQFRMELTASADRA